MLTRAGITAPFIVELKDHPLLPGEHATQQWRRLARLSPPGAGSSPSLPDDDGWIREIKLDGYRAIAFKEYGQSAAPIAQRQYRKIRRRLRLVGLSWAR